jgi:hypothetical protein
MNNETLPTTHSPWTVDARGYLLTPSGAKAARLDNHGILMLYDKRTGSEVPLTLADYRAVQTQTQTPQGEP